MPSFALSSCNVSLTPSNSPVYLRPHRHSQVPCSSRLGSHPFIPAPAILSNLNWSTDSSVRRSSVEITETPSTSTSTALICQKSAAKRKVEELLQSGASLYKEGPEVGPAIDALIAENSTADPGPATLRLGQGTWEVFYAPHIAALSSTLGTRFQPLRYILKGDQLTSNVFYSSSLAQEGWLSSSGRLFSNEADTVEVAFDKFWLDIGSTKLRDSGPEGLAGVKGAVDAAVNAVGQAAFFPQFAVFPVKYLDTDLAVFSFPPLNDSLIAVRKIEA